MLDTAVIHWRGSWFYLKSIRQQNSSDFGDGYQVLVFFIKSMTQLISQALLSTHPTDTAIDLPL